MIYWTDFHQIFTALLIGPTFSRRVPKRIVGSQFRFQNINANDFCIRSINLVAFGSVTPDITRVEFTTLETIALIAAMMALQST